LAILNQDKNGSEGEGEDDDDEDEKEGEESEESKESDSSNNSRLTESDIPQSYNHQIVSILTNLRFFACM
jgi:hypothetical protein